MSGLFATVLAGGLVAIITTIVNSVLGEWLKNRGDLIIYSRVVYQRNSNGRSMEITSYGRDAVLTVPLWIEVQNTKKRPAIVRDFSLALYKDNKMVKKMIQVNEQTIRGRRESKEINYGNNEWYSFVIPEESIRSFQFLYRIKKSDCNSEFDELRIVYHDHRDKLVVKRFKKIPSSWEPKKFDIDDDWVRL